jgi:two-component system, chemotaxis family, protein-glutamate methylesterase/glutaminase
VKVLLVDDSAAVRVLMEGLLKTFPEVELVPSASTCEEALTRIRTFEPHVVLLDLELPDCDGAEVVREVMQDNPRPIVLFSAHVEDRTSVRAFSSLEAGAVEVLAKPKGQEAYSERFRLNLLRTLRLASSARVVRRHFRSEPRPVSAPARPSGLAAAAIAIGSSTGGPPALRALLLSLRRPYPVPVLIAQHIIPGFEAGLAKWLQETGHQVVVPNAGDPVRAGMVYLSRADAHLSIQGDRFQYVTPQGIGPVPSADILFESVFGHYGAEAVSILLTGMGSDGAAAMAKMRAGGAFTIAQTAVTCVVDGMPGAARKMEAVCLDLDPAEIGTYLNTLRLVPAAPPVA